MGQGLSSPIVFRTFSKAAGLASVRIGFAAGHQDVIANLFKVRTVHDINSLALLAASLVIDEPRIIEDHVRIVEAGGRLLAEEVGKLGFEPLPTHTNFILIRVGHRCSPAWLVERLSQMGYLVKGPFTSPCLADCIRVTLGPPDLMKAFVECFARALCAWNGGPKQT